MTRAETFEKTGGNVWIGMRRASGSIVTLRANADELSITTPIVSVTFSPREVVALRPTPGLFGFGGFEIVQTRDRRTVLYRCRDADAVRARILATGFVPRGTAGGGPDPARAALHAEEDRADRRRLLKFGALIAGVLVAVFAAIGFGVALSFGHSEVYRSSWAAVRSDPRVVGAVGAPVASGSPSGSIEVVGSNGQATLRYDVSGPRGRGTVEVAGTRSAGAWHVDRLGFAPEGREGPPIDLLAPR